MNLVHERIAIYATRLRLTEIPHVLSQIAEAEEAAAKDLSYTGFLERILSEEVAAANERMRKTLLRFARFPYIKVLDEFDFEAQPSIDERQIKELGIFRFIAEKTLLQRRVTLLCSIPLEWEKHILLLPLA